MSGTKLLIQYSDQEQAKLMSAKTKFAHVIK